MQVIFGSSENFLGKKPVTSASLPFSEAQAQGLGGMDGCILLPAGRDMSPGLERGLQGRLSMAAKF